MNKTNKSTMEGETDLEKEKTKGWMDGTNGWMDE